MYNTEFHPTDENV